MNAETLYQEMRNAKGQIMRGKISSQVETLKGISASVTKETKGFFRSGISFENLGEVKEAIGNGERGEVQSLPWGQWRENRAPFIVDHKGTEYFRLYPPSEKQSEIFNLKFHVQFFENGAEITRDRAIELCGSKAKAREETPKCFTVKVENIALLGEFDCVQGIETGERSDVRETYTAREFMPVAY